MKEKETVPQSQQHQIRELEQDWGSKKQDHEIDPFECIPKLPPIGNIQNMIKNVSLIKNIIKAKILKHGLSRERL